MALRLKARGTTRRSTVRSTRTLLSFAVAAGLTVQATTAVAAPSDASDPADSGSGDSNATAESFLADLVGEVSSTEGAVASMENELGGLRESVNKARVDLDRAQREAQEAQDNVTDARGRLDSSNSDVEEAQEQLDEIARSAYARGGDAAPVNLAAGGDIAADSLDRATYLRLASEKQQSEIDRLDLVRTQTANEESSLRESRDTADGMVGQARDAHAAAEEAFSSAQSSIAEKSSELEGLRSDLAAAEARLKAAKSAVDRVSANAGASSFDKRRAAENAADRAEARLEGQDDTADQLVEPKVEEVESPEGAEGMEGTESAEAPEGAEAPADVEAPAEQDLGEEGPAESVPAEEDPAVHDEQPDEQPAGDPGLSEGSGAEGSAGGEEGEPVDPPSVLTRRAMSAVRPRSMVWSVPLAPPHSPASTRTWKETLMGPLTPQSTPHRAQRASPGRTCRPAGKTESSRASRPPVAASRQRRIPPVAARRRSSGSSSAEWA